MNENTNEQTQISNEKDNIEIPKNWKPLEGDAWKPTEEGEELVGVLKEIQPKTEKAAAKYIIYDVGAGVNRTVFGTTILDGLLKQVSINTIIKITFKGSKEIGKPQPLKLFTVEVPE